MSASRDALHQLVDGLPDAELAAARRFLEFLSQETVGPRFAESIRRGLADSDAGRTIVCGNYDEMVAKVLGPE